MSSAHATAGVANRGGPTAMPRPAAAATVPGVGDAAAGSVKSAAIASVPAANDPAAAPRLLIVDDEPDLRNLLADYFARHGCTVQTAADASEARAALAARAFDLAVLDVNMPGENGLSLARWMRESRPAVCILMLTTASETIDRVVGLELGADDYLPKPFEVRELLARVRAVLRRAAPPRCEAGPAAANVAVAAGAAVVAAAADVTRQVAFGDCRLDLDQRKLFAAAGAAGADEIAISAAEFDLLALFARHPNRPLNRDQIMEQAHHRGWDVFDRSIDLRVMRLRRKIERNPDKPEVLKTVRNVGYVFCVRDHA